MKYRTLFRLLLKAMGVWFLASGVVDAGESIIAWAAFWLESSGMASFSFGLLGNLIRPLPAIGVGLYLFHSGGWIVDKVIPRGRPY